MTRGRASPDMSDIRINRFNNPLTRQYLQSGGLSLRGYGRFGQQAQFTQLSGVTQFNLGGLYNGNNNFLPDITVNGQGQIPTSYTSLGRGFGDLAQSSAVPSTSTLPSHGFNLQFNGFGVTNSNRANLTAAATPTTVPNIPATYQDWFAVDKYIAEGNLTSLLSDPANTEFTLTQLGLTVTSDGAGSIVNVSHTPTALQRVGIAGDATNTADFALRNPLAASPSSSFPSGSNQPNAAGPKPLTNNPVSELRPLGQPSPFNQGIARADKGNSVEGFNPLASVQFANGDITTNEALQGALQQQLQRRVGGTTLGLQVTGPNAQLSLAESQSLAFQRGQSGVLTIQPPESIRQLLAAKAHAEAVTRPGPERTGVVPLVSPEAPYQQVPSSANPSGLALQLGIGEGMAGGQSQGGSLLGLQLGQTDTQTGGGQEGFQSFQPPKTPQPANGEPPRRPLYFMA